MHGDPREASTGWRRWGDRLTALPAWVERSRLRLEARAQRIPAYLLLVFGATAAWVVLWAWYDLMIVGRAFPPTAGYRPDLDAYWTSTWWVLFPITTILIFRKHAWLPILAVAIAGWEDILFYWIQGAPVPAALAYLPQTPTADLLYLRGALFLAAALLGAIIARRPSLRIRQAPPGLVMFVAGVFGSFWIFVASVPAYVAVQKLLRHIMNRRSAAGKSSP